MKRGALISAIKKQQNEYKRQQDAFFKEQVDTQKKQDDMEAKEKMEKERKIEINKKKKDKLKQKKLDGKYKTSKQKSQEDRAQQSLKLWKENNDKIVPAKKIENEEHSEYDIHNMSCNVICIIGHVNTGKTTFYDYLTKNNMCNKETGSITQMIRAHKLKYGDNKYILLDTPGHSAFITMRQRGTTIGDVALIMIDITQGIEKQTEECLEIIKKNCIPTIIVLNKIDLIYGWMETKKDQTDNVNERVNEKILQITNDLYKYYDSDEMPPMITISSKTGYNMNLLFDTINQKIASISKKDTEINGFVMETAYDEGLLLHVLNKTGELKLNEEIFLTMSGESIKAQIKSMLVGGKNVQEVKGCEYLQMRVKSENQFIHSGAIISKNPMNSKDGETLEIKLDKEGVHLQVSTYGALEACLFVLNNKKISISSYGFGPLKKVDYIKVSSQKDPIILAFDVDINEIMLSEVKKLGIVVICEKVIYTMIDKYVKYKEEQTIQIKKNLQVSFPCILEILPKHIYHKSDPIILGVRVKEGFIKVGTLIGTQFLQIGKIEHIEKDGKELDIAKKGDEVCLKITTGNSLLYGRQFDHKDQLLSRITRQDIDNMKKYYKEMFCEADWKLVINLKKIFGIS